MDVVTVQGGSRGHRWRSRWAAIGAAVAVTLGGGGLFAVNAASGPASSTVTIDPVRILDTRTDVGLPGPFVSLVSQKLQVTGAAVPAGATGVLLNVTVVKPTADGFLSVRPGDATGAPSTSSLNFTAGQTVPNSVQVGLPTTGANAGQIDITYDAFGQAGPTTEVLIDAVGYLVPGGNGTGPAGPPGPQGDIGPVGAPGPRGFSAWDTIPPGVTVRGSVEWSEIGPTSSEFSFSVALPAVAPAPVYGGEVNFDDDASAITIDDDATCAGTVSAPSAPAGKVCIYTETVLGVETIQGTELFNLQDHGFVILGTHDATNDAYFSLTWAYTAP